MDQVLVQFRFICEALPTAYGALGLRLGIQEGKQVVQDVSVSDGSATFDFPLKVTLDAAAETADFHGKYAQGRQNGRFVYLCWGSWQNPAEWVGMRRAKVQLNQIPFAMLQQAVAKETAVVTHIRTQNDKGEPVAASLKPDFVRWVLDF